MVDEFENLTESQQKHLNTLLREKDNPCSFKVGARLYGVKTYSTYCADEDNKEGSEYELLPLDAWLRKDEKRYSAFAHRLVVRRLKTRGLLSNAPERDAEMKEYLARCFEEDATDGLAETVTHALVAKYSNRDRPYIKSLRQALIRGLKSNVTPGVGSANDVEALLDQLFCPQFPLLEKLNCFMLYQEWSAQHDLMAAAGEIATACQTYLATRDTQLPYHDKLLHWKADLLAQLRRESDQKQVYAGFDTFIELSWGNPRHLLILLKHVFAWAAFKDERPFQGDPISAKAQTEGAREAADWFFRDARMAGRDGQLVQDAISRLGTLFRSIRYSTKPSECSLSTFSYEPASISAETRRLLDVAEKWLLLVSVGDQRDRNSERVDVKLQLNRMLAPKWDISFSRRGALAINGEDLNAIFDPRCAAEFDERLKTRIDRMTAPFFGTRQNAEREPSDAQRILFQ